LVKSGLLNPARSDKAGFGMFAISTLVSAWPKVHPVAVGSCDLVEDELQFHSERHWIAREEPNRISCGCVSMIGNLPNRVGNRAVGQVRIRQIGLVRSGFRTCYRARAGRSGGRQPWTAGDRRPRRRAAFREHYGLDKPLPVQYVVYLEHLVQR